ncbi:hypothetical protein [Streptococcus pneumoniae]|uniref:hypothetical protein n=2 Tax=Streptococcus pneumoniae TaxID=1313 RepID=UPI0007693054|nr:hypothetical protein [Streptococcus pneumoniae]CZD02069.1 chlorohydrolase [Streptococcus pneumoniae]
MKIKVQTRKLAAGCSKHCFKVVDGTDEVSSNTYGKVKLTWFEEIFEEYKSPHNKTHTIKVFMYCPQKLDRQNLTFWGQYISIPDTMRFLILKIFYNFF